MLLVSFQEVLHTNEVVAHPINRVAKISFQQVILMRTSTLPLLALILNCCTSQNSEPSPTWDFAKAFLQTVGNDVLEHEGTQALLAHRDGAKYMALLDVNPKDGKLSLAEIEPLFTAPTPESLAMLTILVLGIQRARQ